jgi:hypothetical protein
MRSAEGHRTRLSSVFDSLDHRDFEAKLLAGDRNLPGASETQRFRFA